MNILFITSNRIGDAILSTGILKALQLQHPEAKITIACGPLVADLFKDMPSCHKIIPFKKKGRFGHWWHLWQQSYRISWDIIVDVRGSLLAYVLRSRQRYVWRSQRARSGHRVEQLSQWLKLPKTALPALTISSSRLTRIAKFFQNHQRIIAIAPAANWSGKEWPLDRFIELKEQLTNAHNQWHQASILILAAPHEYTRIQRFIEAIPDHRRILLSRDAELLDCAAALSQAHFFIGNDSGLMHMAAAVGIPTLGLFGPSPEQLYAPYGDKAYWIRTAEPYNDLMQRHRLDPQAPLMTSLTVEKVLQAVHNMLQQHYG